MAAINLTDLNNAKLDVDHIARVATSTGPTSTDRLGHTVPTVAAVLAEVRTGEVGFADKASMDASLIYEAGTVGRVTNDAAPTNNAIYRKLGAAGSGSWVKAADSDQTLTNGRTGGLPAVFQVQNRFQDWKFAKLAGASGAAINLTDSTGHYVKDPNAAVTQTTRSDGMPAVTFATTSGTSSMQFRRGVVADGLATGDKASCSVRVAGTAAGTTRVMLTQYTAAGAEITAARQLQTLAAGALGDTFVGLTGTLDATAAEYAIRIDTSNVSTLLTVSDLLLAPGAIQAYRPAVEPFLSGAIASNPAVAANATAAAAAKQTAGEQAGDLASEGTVLNGAALLLNTVGDPVGLNVPAGQTGVSSFVTTFIQPNAAQVALLAAAGATIRLKGVAVASAGFITAKPAGGNYGSVNRGAGNLTLSANGGTRTRWEQIGTKLYLEATYPVTAADVKFGLTYQIASSTSTAAHSLQFSSLTFDIVSVTADSATTLQDLIVQFRKLGDDARLKAEILSNAYGGRVVVAADGSGNVTTPAAAVAAITDSGVSKSYEVPVRPGEYTSEEVVPPAYTDWKGDARNRVTLQLLYPANTALATISANSVFRLKDTMSLRAVTAYAKNARYVIHSEFSGLNKDAVQEIEDCTLRHFGNQEAMDYQQSIGTAPGTNGSYGVWNNADPIGLGLASGMEFIVRRSRLLSDTRYALGFHNNQLYDRPSRVLVEASQLVGAAAFGSIFFQHFGSMRDDVLELRDCGLEGDIVSFCDSSWMPTDLAYQPANHQEIKVVGSGCSSAMFVVSDFGRALRLDSATTGAASNIELVGGSALNALFGPQRYRTDGVTGTAGFVYGWADVAGGKAGTKLGERLGNCTSVNKTLQLKIDGGSTGTITFTEDYTAMDNTAVLGKINTLLAGAALASLYNPGELVRPRMLDEEAVLANNTATVIPQGYAVAFDANDRLVRLMTSADPASRYVGQAFEAIYPGRAGRIKRRGYVQLAGNDTVPDEAVTGGSAPAVFSTFSISAANPGRIVKGGTQGLLMVMRAAVGTDRRACLKVG